MEGLWRTWIIVWCWGTLAFGAAFAGVAFPATSGPSAFYTELVSGGRIDAAALEAEGMRFALALIGAVMMGWAVTIFGVVRAADQVGAYLWRMLTFGLIVWFAVDSWISVAAGYPLNAVGNTGFVALYLIPVLASGVLREAAPA
ncbi:MAG: hypothetical protein AAFR11_15595 [Pseudomonadota bacterium]